mgnify:CR=1 FL=1
MTVYSSIPGKLPDHVEQAAYFVISESLVNANKHSRATTIDLITAVQDGWLYVTITDDASLVDRIADLLARQRLASSKRRR